MPYSVIIIPIPIPIPQTNTKQYPIYLQPNTWGLKFKSKAGIQKLFTKRNNPEKCLIKLWNSNNQKVSQNLQIINWLFMKIWNPFGVKSSLSSKSNKFQYHKLSVHENLKPFWYETVVFFFQIQSIVPDLSKQKWYKLTN